MECQEQDYQIKSEVHLRKLMKKYRQKVVNENTTKIPSVLTKLFYECSVFVRAFELLTVQLWM